MFFVRYLKRYKDIIWYEHTAIDPQHAVEKMIYTLYDMREQIKCGEDNTTQLDSIWEYKGRI